MVSFLAVLLIAGCSTGSKPGPRARADHWHAAFGVFLCDRYLPDFDASTLPDREGIHGHDDGLVHIHPFSETAAGANAILQRFTDAITMTLTATTLTLAIAEPPLDLKNGDACPNGKPGRLRVVDFSGPSLQTAVEVSNPLQSRFTPDRIFAFVFAPEDVVIPPPPSVAMLDAPSDISPDFALTPDRKALFRQQPELDPLSVVPTELVVEDVEVGTGAVVGPHDTVGIWFLVVRSDGGRVDGNWAGERLLTFKIGTGREVLGLEQGIVGMRVGGVRKIVVPSALGYGEVGRPPFVRANEALSFAVQIIVAKPPKYAVQ